MAKPSVVHTAEQLKAVFKNSVQYEILFTFGTPYHHPADYAQWEFINFTRAAHARLLYDFLSTPIEERYQDDVLAADYGFPVREGLLPAEDRERFNKDMLHLSIKRLRHTPATKPWPDHLLGNLLEPTLAFMHHIRDNRPDIFESPRDEEAWQHVMMCLTTGQELEISAFTLDDQISYLLGIGQRLPDGKPRFTRHIGLGMSAASNDSWENTRKDPSDLS
jgi:hypothetical protein